VNGTPALSARPGELDRVNVPSLNNVHSTPPAPPAADSGFGGGALAPVNGSGSISHTGDLPPLHTAPAPDVEPAANETPPAQNARTEPAAPATGTAGQTRAAGQTAQAPPAAPKQMYKVLEHDTLYTIAGKVYGHGNEPNYKLILEANRSTLPSESKLQVGQELVIPPLPGGTAVVDGRGLHDYLQNLPRSSAPTAGSTPSRTTSAGSASGASATGSSLPSLSGIGSTTTGAPAGSTQSLTPVIGRSGISSGALTRLADNSSSTSAPRSGGLVRMDSAAPITRTSTPDPRTAATPPARAATGKAYTVKPHDCLAAIARAQMGDGSEATVNKLFAANRDKLSSPEKLSPGTVLVIPN
jgi:nucleoid-associated protein YgaU